MPAELVLSAVSWVWLRQPGRVIPDDPTPAAQPSEIAGTAVPTLPAPTPDVLLTPEPAGPIFASPVPTSPVTESAFPGNVIPGSAIPGSAIPTSPIPTSQPTTGAELQPTPYPADLAPAGTNGTWLWIVLLLAVVALTLVGGWWLWRFRGWGPDFGKPRRNHSGKLAGPVSLARPSLDLQAAQRRARRYSPGTRLVNPWGQPSLNRLVDLQHRVKPRLSDCPLMLRWPSQPILNQDGLLKSTQFSPPEITCTRGRTGPARLDTLIRRSALPDLDAQQRWDIAIWIGRFITEMHNAGWAVGTFDWRSFQYCDRPTPHLHVSGIERARELGSEASFAVVADKDWADPRDDAALLPSFEQDRYRYALLVHRLLLASDPAAPLKRPRGGSHPRAGAEPTPAPSRQLRRLRYLAERAAGELHERPTIAEWLAVLQLPAATLATQPGTSVPKLPEHRSGDSR